MNAPWGFALANTTASSKASCADRMVEWSRSMVRRASSARSLPHTRATDAALLILLISTACGHHRAASPILLFNGTGTSPNDVAAFEAVLNGKGLDYATVNSSELNNMSEPQLRMFRLLIVPGGNFEQIGKNLTSGTAANVRAAVEHGLNYLGVCAGAFFAGDSPFNGLNLTSGVKFRFYAAENQGMRKAAVPITVAGAPTLEHYWEDGPELTGWGTVVGKYPDGTPAIVEGSVGSGWVILSGIHPEAPDRWRRGMTFHTPAADDNAYAALLILAALNREPLAHY